MVAVFEVEDQGANLDATLRSSIREHLTALLEKKERLTTVPQDVMKKRLTALKKDSFASCYHDIVCQTVIGIEVGADMTLTAEVTRTGSKCAVTAALFDPRTSKFEATAKHEGACSEDGVLQSIEVVVDQLDAPKPKATFPAECSKIPGRATFGSQPFGARLFVNGEEIGTTPIHAYKLPSECTLDIRAVAPDGRERTAKIQLAPNMVRVYNLTFPE